jgi:hypothetical protein
LCFMIIASITALILFHVHLGAGIMAVSVEFAISFTVLVLSLLTMFGKVRECSENTIRQLRTSLQGKKWSQRTRSLRPITVRIGMFATPNAGTSLKLLKFLLERIADAVLTFK